MSDDASTPRVVNVNQIVARNMAYYRNAAKLTQGQLGELLGGWTVTAVSAAERSWDGKRVREFDGPLILSLSRALGIPPLGLFLPPGDETEPYLVETRPGEQLSPAEYFAAVMPDSDARTTVMDDYRNHLIAASLRYQDADWGEGVLEMLRDMTAPEIRSARLDRIRWQREALLSAAADLGEIGALIRAEDGQG